MENTVKGNVMSESKAKEIVKNILEIVNASPYDYLDNDSAEARMIELLLTTKDKQDGAIRTIDNRRV